MSVDFPAPLGPRKARTLPAWTSRSTPASATVPPNRLTEPADTDQRAPASEGRGGLRWRVGSVAHSIKLQHFGHLTGCCGSNGPADASRGLEAAFGPDDLALREVARAPALRELRDEEQAASALVGACRPAQVRARCCWCRRPRRSGCGSCSSRTRMGPAPCRMALVISSLRISSAANAASSSPQSASSSHGGRADLADEGRVGGQLPGGDAAGVEGVDAGDEQGDVVVADWRARRCPGPPDRCPPVRAPGGPGPRAARRGPRRRRGLRSSMRPSV